MNNEFNNDLCDLINEDFPDYFERVRTESMRRTKVKFTIMLNVMIGTGLLLLLLTQKKLIVIILMNVVQSYLNGLITYVVLLPVYLM